MSERDAKREQFNGKPSTGKKFLAPVNEHTGINRATGTDRFS